MRVLYFTRSFTVHDRRFLKAFGDYGLMVGFLSLYELTSGMLDEVPAGIHKLGSLGLVPSVTTDDLDSSLHKYTGILEDFVPDIVLAGPLTDCAYIAAGSKTRIPWVAQSWAFDILWENEREDDAKVRIKFALTKCSGLFADCDAVLDRCRAASDREFSHHAVLPWGIDLRLIDKVRKRNEIRAAMGIGDKVMILHTRGLEPIYGISTLLTGFLSAYRNNGSLVLVLASTGSQTNLVSSFIAENNLKDVVILLGRLDSEKVYDLFSAADIYLSCALCDGTSVSLLESMALGVVPIVPDVGGNKEWIKDGSRGWLFTPGDQNSLANALIDASGSDSLRRLEIVARNKNTIYQSANWEKNIVALVSFLESVARQ
ncbi:MAG: glycosyltransferase family 4 protein [Nibricoccus sp.]